MFAVESRDAAGEVVGHSEVKEGQWPESSNQVHGYNHNLIFIMRGNTVITVLFDNQI